jgi:hypothetical protein
LCTRIARTTAIDLLQQALGTLGAYILRHGLDCLFRMCKTTNALQKCQR